MSRRAGRNGCEAFAKSTIEAVSLGVIMLLQRFLMWLSRTLYSLDAIPNDIRSRSRARMNAGQGLVEYALILVFVGVTVMLVLVILGPSIGNMYRNILDTIENTIR